MDELIRDGGFGSDTLFFSRNTLNFATFFFSYKTKKDSKKKIFSSSSSFFKKNPFFFTIFLKHEYLFTKRKTVYVQNSVNGKNVLKKYFPN